MKHALLIICILTATGCNVAGGLFSSAASPIIEEEREAEEFDQIELRGSGEIFMTQGPETKLEVVARENALDNIRTSVVDSTLRISYRGQQSDLGPVEIYITTPDLTSVKIIGSGSINTHRLETDQFSFDVAGSGRANIEELVTGVLSVWVDGSGGFTGIGQTDVLKVWLTGSGSYEGADLNSRDGLVWISGSSTARVSASEKLEIDISGSGKVEYSGNPRVTQDVSGSGNVSNVAQ